MWVLVFKTVSAAEKINQIFQVKNQKTYVFSWETVEEEKESNKWSAILKKDKQKTQKCYTINFQIDFSNKKFWKLYSRGPELKAESSLSHSLHK